jgi:uncharacterized membrane protein HdeD (DUF308 family)
MGNASFIDSLFHGRLRAASKKLFWSGLATVVLGIAAIAFPSISTMAVTLLVGWLLLIFGLITIINSFSIQGTGPFFGALLLGLLSLAAGVYLLFHPVVGETALTLVVGMIFMFQGAFEIVFAFETRPLKGWVGLLLSGIASIVLSVLIMAGWPAISVVAVGILLGVDFISTGFGLIFVSRALKPAA